MNNTINKNANHPVSKQQEVLIKRYNLLARESVEILANKKRLAHVSGLTDVELARLMFEALLENITEISPRELRKIQRLNEGSIQFAERLKQLGGTGRASQIADILDVSRQTVNNRQKAGKLLAIKMGEEYRFPLFQFDGGKIIDGLEEVLTLLGNFSDVTKISFLTGMHFFDNENINVIDALKKYGRDSEYMDVIRKQAALFGHQNAH